MNLTSWKLRNTINLRTVTSKEEKEKKTNFEHHWDHRPPDLFKFLLKWDSERKQMHLGSVESLRFDNTFTF